MRLTEKKTIETIKAKAKHNKEELIYLELAKYEDAIDKKELFTRSQLSKAIMKGAEMLADVVKVKMTKEILLTLLAEIKEKQEDGKITYDDAEKMALEIIKKVAETKWQNMKLKTN